MPMLEGLLANPGLYIESRALTNLDDYRTIVMVGSKADVAAAGIAMVLLKVESRLLEDIDEREGGWGTTMVGDKKVHIICTPLICSRHK